MFGITKDVILIKYEVVVENGQIPLIVIETKFQSIPTSFGRRFPNSSLNGPLGPFRVF